MWKLSAERWDGWEALGSVGLTEKPVRNPDSSFCRTALELRTASQNVNDRRGKWAAQLAV